MSNHVLVANALSKVYKEEHVEIPVLQGLNLAVKQGEMVAIVGVSGAGKTTLLQLLGGLDSPSSGEVLVRGQSMASLSEKAKGLWRNRHLGFVYQFHHLLPEFNALENVCLPLLIRGESPKEARRQALYYIEKVELSHRLSHRVGELSGGERQRIAIARALVTQPSCVLADEPTGNLDHKTGKHVMDLMRMLNQHLGTSFVIVTHNLEFAQQLHRVEVLESGRLRPQLEAV